MELTFDLPMSIDHLDDRQKIRYLWDQLYLLNEKLNLLTTNTTYVTNVSMVGKSGGGSGGGGGDSGDIVVYDGATDITPLAYEDQTLYTANKKVLEDIQLRQIPFSRTSNQDGTTINIG